ncbi:MAG: metallophosphoesterase [Chthonomonas sp.]|nr:metallophosphoesterase [Chthonomonas sp.]
MNRREFLVASAAIPALAQATPTLAAPKRALRIAHLTDIHVQPERKAQQGLEACLAHAQSLKDKPNLVMTGGDLVMDSLGADPARLKQQWDIFTSVFRQNCSLPVEHCLGNHDVWGWNDIGKYGNEPKFGKAYAQDRLELAQPYRSFDRAGWHFVVLDSTHRKTEGNGYTARLDDEQFAWLADDLAKTPKTTPIFVLSHIPILAVCSMFDGENEKTGNWVIPGAWMHIDARRIKDLFAKHPNVKLCVSGHEHLHDQILYNGVTYVCAGAVCGGWWGGDYYECTYGYSVIDLFRDGTFRHEYMKYGWKTQA